MPIPYYYKKQDGTLYNMQYEKALFDDKINVIDYKQCDMNLHSPEVIFIQNPYDEWNMTMSVLLSFYSSNLKKYTEKLVYIPYFKVDEFGKDYYGD